MPRYFLEISYRGTNYSGFQVQENANTIQAEVEKALAVLYRQSFQLTGSSRTDAGVHALQNYFHFDTELLLDARQLYNLNSILPPDIAANNLFPVSPNTHCRFDALSREYKYYITRKKNPFLQSICYHYPYPLNIEALQKLAAIIPEYSEFTSFSKKNSDVKTFTCNIFFSQWRIEDECYVFYITANRFLRGMIRGLIATMLKVTKGRYAEKEFRQIIESNNNNQADFTAPPHGLFLVSVKFPGDYFKIE